MPGVTRYIPPTDDGPDLTDLEQLYETELRARQKAHREAWALYDGDHPKHLKPDGSGTDDNITINMVELLVDKGVSALVGTNDQGDIEGVTLDIVDEPGEPGYDGPADPLVAGLRSETPRAPNPAQVALDRAWETNKRDVLLHNAVLNGGVCGHVFLKILPDGARDPRTGAKNQPRLVNLNPDIVSVFWDESDFERVLWYRIEYGPERGRKRQDIVRNVDEAGEDADGWTIHNYTQSAQRAGWVRVGEPAAWEYEWPPIVDWQNLPNPNSYYGRNDIRQDGAVNASLNFLLSNTQRIIKHHAHPKTIIIGARVDEIKPVAGADRLWAIPNENAKALNLEMQSDLASSMDLVKMLRRFFFDAGREVDPSSVHDRLGDLTNFALRVLYTDTLAKGGSKRLLAGEGLRDLCRRLLDLLGFGYAHPITVTWPKAIPTDAQADAQALSIDRQHGLSRETYLEKRGYMPQQELERREMERQEQIEDARVQQQGTMADALEGIGRRMMLGVSNDRA